MAASGVGGAVVQAASARTARIDAALYILRLPVGVGSGARRHVGHEVAEYAAADRHSIERVNDLADVTPTQVRASDLLGDQRIMPASEAVAAALHVRDVSPLASVSEGDRLFIDDAHVA